MKLLSYVLLLSFAFQLFIFTNGNAFTGQKVEPIMVGNTQLPDQVQHLNTLENYIVGNGIVCASGMGNGEWDFFAGPDYTCPNLIHNEKIAIIIDDVEHKLNLEMFRARETGLFYGTTQIDDLKITLIDAIAKYWNLEKLLL